MIRKFVLKNHDTWAYHFPLFKFTYNSAVHSTTGLAPFVAELARMPLMPIAMLVPEKDVSALPRPIREYVQDLTKQLQLVRQQVLKRDEQVADSRNLISVGSDEVWSLLPGDEVLVYAPYLPINTEHRKHFMAWKGPFFVSKEIAADVFEVVGIEAGVPTAYHRSKLKRYERPDPQQTRLSPGPALLKFVDGKIEYEVEEVLDHCEVRGKRQYLLQWKSTPESSWEWEVNLHGCLDLLKEYLGRIGEQGRVFPPELTSAVPTGTSGRGGAPSTGASPMPPPLTRTTRTGGPSPGPLRRSRRLQQQNAAP